MSLTNIGQAFKYFGDVATKIPAVVSDCESCVGIIDDFKNIALIFANPVVFLEKVGFNIFWHYRDITNDISAAIVDYENDNFYEFGEFIG